MQEEFVIADTHFAHRNIVFHCDRRKWLYDNEFFDYSKPYDIKTNNPKCVDLSKHDENLIEYWNKRVGKKRLVLGNHDKMNRDCYNLFDKVYDFGCCRKIQQQNVTLCHYSLRVWPKSHNSSWCLYGHSHGRLMEWENRLTFDVGVDTWGYAPVPWVAIQTKMKQKIENIETNKGGDEISEFQERSIKSPSERMIKNRNNNLNILRQLGIEIFVDENWK